MPQLEVTTKSATSVWKSPDGQREIFELQLEWQGKPVSAKTYSKDIATEGWKGTVESYEKSGRNGIETFVKQPQKEGYSGGGGYRGGGGGKPMADPYTMYLSYAKDIVVAHVTAQTKEGSAMTLDDSVAAVIQYGNMLYEARPDAPKASSETKSEPLPVKPDDVQDVNEDEPIDLSKIDELFPGSEEVK